MIVNDGKFNVSLRRYVWVCDIVISCINKNKTKSRTRTRAHLLAHCVSSVGGKRLLCVDWLWNQIRAHHFVSEDCGIWCQCRVCAVPISVFSIPFHCVWFFYSPNFYQLELRFSSWFVVFIVFMTVRDGGTYQRSPSSSFSFHWQWFVF